MQRVDATFEPRVNGEHVGFAWAPVTEPPEPLHPGVRVALHKLSMHELDVAKAIDRALKAEREVIGARKVHRA